MPANGVSRAAKIRAERKESLRELIAQQKHEEHVVELVKKLESLDKEMDTIQVSRIGKAIDTRLKLLAKYLPDEKEAQDLNLGNKDGEPFRITWAE